MKKKINSVAILLTEKHFLYIALSYNFSNFFTKICPECPNEKSLPTKTLTVNSPLKELSNAL